MKTQVFEQKMRFSTTPIEGLYIIQPQVFDDYRGSFFESFQYQKFLQGTGSNVSFVQDNISVSKKNILRGLHFQDEPYAQGKLVNVVYGKVQDVVVDIRKNSPTLGQYYSIILSDKNCTMLYIPPGFAHGFLALKENTIFSYKCTKFYYKKSEKTLMWNDPDLAIEWMINDPILSDKDSEGFSFKTLFFY